MDVPTILGNTDETKEPKAYFSLSGIQLAGLKLESPQIGQCIELCVEACITSINSFEDEKGIKRVSVSFDMERVTREEPEPDPMHEISNLYPAMMKVTK